MALVRARSSFSFSRELTILCVREDKSHHAELAIRLVSVTGCPVAVPNYRLTPPSPTPETQLHHPAHAEDILASLEFLIGPSSPVFDIYAKNVSLDFYLIGHSCSAHMLTTIFLDSSRVTPTLTPSPTLLAGVKAITMSEGIYDIDLLIKNFPAYERGGFGFIVNTFGDRSGLTYAREGVCRCFDDIVPAQTRRRTFEMAGHPFERRFTCGFSSVAGRI